MKWFNSKNKEAFNGRKKSMKKIVSSRFLLSLRLEYENRNLVHKNHLQ